MYIKGIKLLVAEWKISRGTVLCDVLQRKIRTFSHIFKVPIWKEREWMHLWMDTVYYQGNSRQRTGNGFILDENLH